MKKKAVVFPCDQDLCSLSAYIEFDDYNIIGLVAPEDSNAFSAATKSEVPVISITETDYNSFDSIILVDSEIVSHPFIEEGIRRGKNIIHIEQERDFNMCFLEGITEEQQITVPVVFVAGVAPYTEKFLVQLFLRKKLLENDYRVSQIGSNRYSRLFGFHSYPEFMDGSMNNEQKIVSFKKYVKYIEVKEHPDTIVVGIPGGIIPVSKKHHFDFGITAYMISQAISADYVIMNMLYGKRYTGEQLEEIRQVCRYRHNFEIDSFHLSNTLLDPTSLIHERLKFIKLGKREYEQKVDGLYDLMNPADMDKMYENMITKLSSYNVNQIF